MRFWFRSGAAVAAKLLAACVAAAPAVASAASYRVFYTFPDGAGQYPGTLTIRGNALYGVFGSGSGGCNCGSVYRLGADGAFKILHSSSNGPGNGAFPTGMTLVGEELVGATAYGGMNNGGSGCGTIFKSGADDKFHQIYEFYEICTPSTDLTTAAGAAWGAGYFMQGIFKIMRPAKETFYSLGSLLPNGPLLSVGDEFYVTTYATGQFCQNGNFNCGTISGLNRRTGQVSTLHAFHNGTDGAFPSGSLAYLHNAIYGTNPSVIYKVTRRFVETTLHTFAGGQDGANPIGVVEFNGIIYGTTSGGGTYGYGTIFSVTSRGKYKILHSFAGGADGIGPEGQLTVWGDALYGVTYSGGGSGCLGQGCGIVFRIKP